MAWPAPWRDNGRNATVIVSEEPACVHPRILLMLHETVDTFCNCWPDHSCLWIISLPTAIMKVSCATAPCSREPAAETECSAEGAKCDVHTNQATGDSLSGD